jgi:hypothetical protein
VANVAVPAFLAINQTPRTRSQRAFNHKIPSEWCRYDLNNFVQARVVQQSCGEFFPRFRFESETTEKFRLVLAVAMRG